MEKEKIQGFADFLRPIVERLPEIDLNEAKSARAKIESIFPFNGIDIAKVRSRVEAALKEGWLVPKENNGIKFGRITKDLDGYSVDAVLMSTAGPRHRHGNGEIDLCFARSGNPKFDGQPEGWVVYPPSSVHSPTVTDGEMVILYFLPKAAIEFL